MSRIPVPTSSTSPSTLRNNRDLAASPTPYSSLNPSVNFPSGNIVAERSLSPLPGQQARRPNSAAAMSTLSGYSHGSLAETRKKTSKRDEAIRKKIESELSRKRTISTHQPQPTGASRSRRAKSVPTKGTVAALKPSPALTVPESITVAEASQLCAAKRTDCVLVVDDEEGLSGIFTAKDLAYRVTAEGLDPHTTPVSQIMTRNPMVTRDTTSATEALQLMVSRHFRHLPVCNEDGNVVGLLDITKVFHEALGKVERSSAASEQLFNAMAGVQSELGGVGTNPQAAAMLAWAEKLREKTALPDLTTVMDSSTNPATVGPKTTVREVAKLMKERRTTAVCVMEPAGSVPGSVSVHPRIAGIFTSKDVVLRVIAAGLDAGRCSVVRVMTPHPDTAPPNTTVHDALKKMHNGHYLNLPVVEEDGRLVAIVDVLKLTYATLEQMNAMSGETATSETDQGPMWGRFFDSLGHDDNESVLSGSQATGSAFPSISNNLHLQQSPHSEVHPNDSASVVDDDNGSVLSYSKKRGVQVPLGGTPVQVEDGTYVFKFRTPSGRTHRFQSRYDDVQHLREIVAGKLAIDPFFTQATPAAGEETADPNDFHLSYTDEDGDSVLMTTDSDVADAVKIARVNKVERVVLCIQGGKGWAEVVGRGEERAREVSALAAKEEREVEKDEKEKAKVEEQVEVENVSPKAESPVPAHVPAVAPRREVQQPQDDVMGIPKDLLLPASIGVLAAVIVGVFTISRLTSNQY
ncbi:CBS and PB1 domain-containing protein [Coprinopsis marcescibilis]|uniref:CBS and PB1 domain-containing protein n=1 Tax=Coprinopsis marcescibilis TaxID=230819 RepID=A0A5C3KRJ4_COPMA|nr:CBS and PB1 domain-containing protein [Coprinopsis marcescibilis]